MPGSQFLFEGPFVCRLAILHRGMPHGLHRLLRFYGESFSLQFPADCSERNSQSKFFLDCAHLSVRQITILCDGYHFLRQLVGRESDV